MAEIKSISILGCGWYGFALAETLIKEGFHVKGSTTNTDKFEKFEQAGISPYVVKIEANSEIIDPAFFHSDLLIISIPPKRNSGEATIFLEKIRRIKSWLINQQVKRVLFISSTGVYGDHNTEVDEECAPLPESESGKALLASENLLNDQSAYQMSIIRFGGLIGPGRDPGRFFAGKKNIPNGKAPVNLIHLEDCIGITLSIIRTESFGYTFNACSPSHPPKMEFYTKAASNSGYELPHFIPELKEWKIVKSKWMDQLLHYSPKVEL